MGLKSIFILLAVLTFYTCIDPFNPGLSGHESLLVVDGLISDADASCSVRLSRTLQTQDATTVMVTDAVMYITDDEGINNYLINRGNGMYYTDSTSFRGEPGRTYVLHISTSAAEYESEPVTMQPSTDIDSIWYEKDKELVNNGTESVDGIRIFLDAGDGGAETYHRWDFEETWKFKVPSPKKYDYDLSDSQIVPHHPVNDYCWKSRKSSDILVSSGVSGKSSGSRKVPIFFIGSDQSDRLLIQYSILVKQYSITKKEYEFWDNIRQVNGAGDDIFGRQPYPITGNVRNIDNPDEKVLGYFQVASVRERRKDIPISEIKGLGLPYYHYPCTRIEMAPGDYPRSPLSPPLTWTDLYVMYCVTSNYYLVEVKYLAGTDVLDKMVFALPECSDCELTGTSAKPDFWTDLQ